MRKWLWIGSVIVALGGVGGYLYFAEPAPDPVVSPLTRLNEPPKIVDDGNGEASDAIEPIRVDTTTPAVRRVESAKDDGPMPRVVLESGMTQPPRPDAALVPPMPEADD